VTYKKTKVSEIVKKFVGCGNRKRASFVLWGEKVVAKVSVGGLTSSEVWGPIFHGVLGGILKVKF